jgi:hypothetical protein
MSMAVSRSGCTFAVSLAITRPTELFVVKQLRSAAATTRVPALSSTSMLHSLPYAFIVISEGRKEFASKLSKSAPPSAGDAVNDRLLSKMAARAARPAAAAAYVREPTGLSSSSVLWTGRARGTQAGDRRSMPVTVLFYPGGRVVSGVWC